MAKTPVLVVEDDPFTRLISIVLDPRPNAERWAAFINFMSHDESNFEGWMRRVRAASSCLYPAEVRLVDSQQALRDNLVDCDILVVESLQVGNEELSIAKQLKVVQKFGTTLRNIDTAALAAKNVKLKTLRRRANISCAEHAFALMLMLARKLETVSGLVTVERINAAGLNYRPYDRRHSAGGNFARVPGTRALNGSTIGIIGLGEIGREIARRAVAFDMQVLYHQRTRAAESEEQALHARYVSLETLLAESDWIIPQLPTLPATRGYLGREQLALLKREACIVNVGNAALINREALIDVLRSGKLAGFALDVFYQEPLADNDELLNFDNVILTPRMAGSPRINALQDFEELITGLAREIE
ncbi:MAG: NAD(P)-dependent oxidoreductase [Burkholderiales bacterium]